MNHARILLYTLVATAGAALAVEGLGEIPRGVALIVGALALAALITFDDEVVL